MSERISNARMYAVTAQVEDAWRELLAQVAREAAVPLTYLPYPAPQPLETLWSRPDLGAVFMCGYPIALKLAPVVPLAAPVPRAPWAQGRAVYRTDLIVRADAPYRALEDTFGGRAGWTVAHSQSGFNAFRHHLLAFRETGRPALYREMQGNLVTARNVLDAVRVLTSTALTPLPALVASAGTPAEAVTRLRAALTGAVTRPWFAALAQVLLIEDFVEVAPDAYGIFLDWDAQARAAGFP